MSKIQQLFTEMEQYWNTELPLVNGLCAFQLNQTNVTLEIDASQEFIYLHDTLAQLNTNLTTALASAIFERNLYGRETGLTQIGIDNTKHALVLYQILMIANLDSQQLITEIEQFAAQIKQQTQWYDSFCQQQNGLKPVNQASGSSQVNQTAGNAHTEDTLTRDNFLRV